MPTNESLRETLSYFKQQRERKLQEAKAFDLTIQQLERELGEPASGGEIPITMGDSIPAMADHVEMNGGKKLEIRPDEFFGMTQAEAARKYLKRVGHAVSFDELVSALQTGGCRVGGENPKRVLYISLIRNTRDFVPPQQGYIGLREFYPGAGRPAKDRVEKVSKKRRGTKKSRSSGKRHDRPPMKIARSEKDSKKQPSELAVAVRSILSDRQPHSVDEILTAITAKLGRSVKKIGVLGTLRNQYFEKVDGKYQLAK